MQFLSAVQSCSAVQSLSAVQACSGITAIPPIGAAFNPLYTAYSVDYDGTDDFGSIPHNAAYNFGTGDFSVKARVKFDDTASNYFVVKDSYAGSTSYTGFLLYASVGKIRFQTRDRVSGSGPVTTCTALANFSTDTWYDVVGTRINNELKLYINAVLQDTQTESVATDIDNAVILAFGKLSTYAADTLNGHLTNIALWNSGLVQDEVTALYAGGDPTNPAQNFGDYASSADIVGNWLFTENTGVTVADSSSNANDATLTNGPTWSSDVPSS